MCSPKYIEIEFLVHMCTYSDTERNIHFYLFIYFIGNGFDTDPDPGGSRCPCHASFIKEFSTAESAKSGRLFFLLINKICTGTPVPTGIHLLLIFKEPGSGSRRP